METLGQKIAKSPRDVRLDFFRGIAMCVIFIAHVPANSWYDFIPARFGFSSAAEVFVFCSGLASSYAFGRVFLREGWLTGTARVLFRIWQVYWSHIGLALVMMAITIAGSRLSGQDYIVSLGLEWFFAAPLDGFIGLMTLMFTPNFLDILPMYLILLAGIPLVMALARLSPLIVLAGAATLWLFVQITHVNLPGGTQPGMMWFFNPFAWQIVFFCGFAFGMGWLPTPVWRKGLLFRISLVFLIVSVPLNFWGVIENVPTLMWVHESLAPYTHKTHQPILLFVHFLAFACVALTLVEPYRDCLHRFFPIITIGQQALAAFMASLVLAWLGGMALDQLGRGAGATALVNITGLLGLYLSARIAAYFKQRPWEQRAAAGAPRSAPMGAERAQPAE